MLAQYLVLAALQPWCPLSPDHLCHEVEVTCKTLDDSHSRVEVTTTNVAQHRIDLRLQVVLSLHAVLHEEEEPRPGYLLSSFDPVTGASDGFFGTPPASIELPVGASYTVVLELTRLRWSLSPEDVTAPTELWKLDAWGEYEVHVEMERYPRQDYSSVDCRPALVRIPRG